MFLMQKMSSNWFKFKTFIKGPEKSFFLGTTSEINTLIKQFKINTVHLKEAGATEF
jgi:hypothetical protein